MGESPWIISMGLCWTTSRPAPSTLAYEGDPDVDYCGRKNPPDEGIRDQGRRHRFAGSPDSDPDLAHFHPDRALQDPQEGQPRPPWPSEDGCTAPQAAGLPQGQGRAPVSEPDPEPR